MDQEDNTGEDLKKVMLGLKEKALRYWERREVVLWTKMNVPFSLGNVLRKLTKDELTNIRRKLQIQGISALNKMELTVELQKLVPIHAFRGFNLFDEDRYRLAKGICSKSGFVHYQTLPLDLGKIEYFRARGLVFSATWKGKKVFSMPLEVMDAFRKIDSPDYRRLVGQNTEWARLIHGLLYYYGVLTSNQLIDMMRKLVGEDLNIIHFLGVLYDTMAYNMDVQSDGKYFFCKEIFNAKQLFEEQEKRSDLEYYPFTKAQLLKAGEPRYVDVTPELSKLIEFFCNHYEVSMAEAKQLAARCYFIFRSNGELKEAKEFLEDNFEFPSEGMVRELTRIVIDLSNNTRMWSLKGHTPQELTPFNQLNVKPLPARSGTNVIDINSRRTGRNAPCPCGSGKKYKQCCGRDT